ncbi:MAG: hypothetical protein EZS28_030878 [Streblomastix strix]|uniref:Uncharacterized protein n=1 Tax=Streblomastix strix TaxID=222440 RepID=A0A5J4UV13_9EUKA|nr:MAG: hypothetical protein EZS28_030878 [Streblomastix strix]
MKDKCHQLLDHLSSDTDNGYYDKLVSHAQSKVRDPLIQYAGQTPFPALGSADDRQLHLDEGIPDNCEEFVGHIQPEGQFDQVGISLDVQYDGQISPARGSPVLKHGQSEAHCSTEQSLKFVSQTHSNVVLPLTQQAGQYSFPALGSLVLKHGQLASLDKLHLPEDLQKSNKGTCIKKIRCRFRITNTVKCQLILCYAICPFFWKVDKA